jgi:hypothetical protein
MPPRELGATRWLRWIGCLVFLGGACSFLVEGWTDEGVLGRTLAWAAVSLALTVLGILSVRRLRDATGARIFLGLAAATIPAHFAQLGATTWAYWVEGTSRGVALAGAAAVVLLLGPPLCLGVSALVRRRGFALTALLFALSLPLVVPSRSGNLTAGLALAELGLLVVLELRFFRYDPVLATLEGIAARTLLAAPCAILLVRNAFYAPTPLWIAALMAVPGIVLLTVPHVCALGGVPSRVLQACGMAGVLGALCATRMDPRLLGLTASVVALVGTRVTGIGPKLLGRVAAAAFVATTGAIAICWSPLYGLLALPVGALHALSAYERRSLPQLVLTGLASVVALTVHLAALVRLPSHGIWVAPAALGIALLWLASLFERHRAKVDRVRLRLVSHFGAGISSQTLGTSASGPPSASTTPLP